MERELADRLGAQQADMEEQAAHAQAKLTSAQAARESARALHAEVLRAAAADEAAAGEAAAARGRLASLRGRLSELRSLNDARRARAASVTEQAEQMRVRGRCTATALAVSPLYVLPTICQCQGDGCSCCSFILHCCCYDCRFWSMEFVVTVLLANSIQHAAAISACAGDQENGSM
jgi:multidrug efflux pump subunit AcrA (membrane-fusion protein)